MKKLSFSVLALIVLAINIYSQDVKKQDTKFDQFTSKTGTTIKFIDFKLPDLDRTHGAVESRVRKIIIGNEAKYFYQISKEGKYDTKQASIIYEDLLEVIKAFQKLQKDAPNDLALHPDYLENKFVTDDGFQLGYYVSDNKLVWYAVLEKYGSDNTVFLKDAETIANSLNSAKNKIESLKK